MSPAPASAFAAKRDDTDDSALMAGIVARDRQAFATLYDRYAPRLGGYLWKMLRRQELVDEALNDTLMAVWEKPESYRQRSRLSSWLFGIAHNKALKLLEKSKRHAQRHVADSAIEDAPDPDSPQQRAVRGDLLKQLVGALDELSAEHRSVIELTFHEGLSYTEIADVMDCPVNTVKTRVFNARKRMLRYLADQGLDIDAQEHVQP